VDPSSSRNDTHIKEIEKKTKKKVCFLCFWASARLCVFGYKRELKRIAFAALLFGVRPTKLQNYSPT
jgi:cytosine/uracil/thiamine/allantoin permease